MHRPVRVTYRLQLTAAFGFDAAAAVLPYLAELGVSHLYASPVLQAVPGSMHGYDVVDHGRISKDLGGPEAHVRLHSALERAGLGQILDIVPNHMAIGTRDNALWWDVLENGPASEVASYFDVDWDASKDNRVLLPILGEHYVDALEQQLVKLEREDARFLVHYYDHVLPSAPRSVAELLRAAASSHDEMGFWADALDRLPAPWATDRESTARRHRDKAVIFDHLSRLFREQTELAEAVDRSLLELNAQPKALDAWLERQNWRLAHWKNASTELGYRRFFDVNTLAGLRVEDPRVFARSHRLILRWLRDGTLDGVRVDHVDGLRDPEEYLRRLREAAPDAYLVVEKILSAEECLPDSWPVDGTTGYEFARLLDQVFLDGEGELPLTEFAQRFAGQSTDWDAQVRAAKLQILDQVLASEREHLVEMAYNMLRQRLELRDTTRRSVFVAITELLAAYPVYRTYVRAEQPPQPHDLELIHQVVTRAAEAAPDLEPRLWNALEQALSLQLSDDEDGLPREFALRLQQATGAITAKAIEDTLFYRHVRLIALNEVGGTPEQFGMSVDQFHRRMVACNRPRSMLASSTHDTKRGEDMRARLLVLSEVPDAWERAVTRWSARAERYRDTRIPRATEYWFYQTLVGAHPLTVDRAWQYMQKSIREAKQNTSWINSDEAFEGAVERFVRGVFEDRELLADVEQFVAGIAPAGYVLSLGRTLIKLTAPGVPDLYQGSELWDFSLVDPDNRRPVDFELRTRMLARLPQLRAAQTLDELESGLPKMWLTWKALSVRRHRPEVFEREYRPVAVQGESAEHVIAFMRGGELVTVVPRSVAQGDLRDRNARVLLPAGGWRDVLSGQRVEADAEGVRVGSLWAEFPVALLERQS
jgi:(1->4)-alpha-D-glucan 1-alpha-D-glucosylmutase